MGNLVMKTASGGAVILSPTNTAVDTTVTIPAVTGSFVTADASGIASIDGRLGIGVTPNAGWGSAISAMQVGTLASFYQGPGGGTNHGNNLYNDGITTRYITTAGASIIGSSTAGITLNVYSSGTAGTIPITTATLLNLDNVGNVTLNTPGGGLGYGTGAGGTVTQATSKATAVTLNKPTGRITMNGAALAAGGVVIFAVNNTLMTVNDCVVLTLGNIGGGLSYNCWCSYSSTSLFYVALQNITGGSLSEAVVVKFAIIKGATA